MNKRFIENRNFKKIFAVYLILSIVCAALCSAVIGYIYRDKLTLALKYNSAREALEKQGSADTEALLDGIANASADVIDVLTVDSQNTVTYSASNSAIVGRRFSLKRDENGLLTTDMYGGAALRFLSNDEFMLSAVFSDVLSKFSDKTEKYEEEEYFYLNGGKNAYLISRISADKKSGARTYVIIDPTPVKYGTSALKAAAGIFMLLFMIYWVIIALWVYQNAKKLRLSAPVWGIITLCTNLAGVLVYTVYKHSNSVCPCCGAAQPRSNTFCTFCGAKIGLTCPECGHGTASGDSFCSSCGHKIK